MQSSDLIHYVDEDAFENMRLPDADVFVAAGEGKLAELVSVLSPQFESWFDATTQTPPTAGTLGLTKHGSVVACLDWGLAGHEAEALSTAAEALSLSETAVVRRREAGGEFDYLDPARLSDPRRKGFPNA